MLTPKFNISQDELFLTITIYAPFTTLSLTEVFMEEHNFSFYSKPYFLRLYLPKEIEDSDLASGVYDSDSRSFVIKAPKKVPGVFFEGLDLLPRLLQPKKFRQALPNISFILTEEERAKNGILNDEAESDEDDFLFSQEFPESPKNENQNSSHYNYNYGFGLNYKGVFGSLDSELNEILDIKSPDSYSLAERRNLRLSLENEDFSSDHYLADFFESTESDFYTHLEYPDLLQDPWTTEEKDYLLKLPRSKKNWTQLPFKSLCFGLFDILLAYSYDYRTTHFEHNSESGWTISKLSSLLSCSESFDTYFEVLQSFFRRSLTYPLYRNWNLSYRVLQDVFVLLHQRNRRSLIKSLLKIHKIFTKYEGRYIFNQLYIEPYILWFSYLSKKQLIVLQSIFCFSEKKENEFILKSEINFDLLELEEAGRLCRDEENLESVTQVLSKTNLDSDDDDSSSDSKDDNSSDSNDDNSSDSNDDNSSDSEEEDSDDKSDDENSIKFEKNLKEM